VWSKYIENNEDKKLINNSVYIFNSILIIVALAAIFTKFYLPAQLYSDILPIKWLCILIVFIFPLSGIIFAALDKRLGVFISYIFLILFLSAFGMKQVFLLDYKFGQNDLMNFGKYAKENNKKIVAYNTGRRYSLIYYGVNDVKFLFDDELQNFGDYLKKNDVVLIMRKKDVAGVGGFSESFDIIQEGRKYIMLTVKN
jgi:hypothetical protein